MVSVIGDPDSSPAKRKNGSVAWKTRRMLAADSALTLIFRLLIASGDKFALNSTVLLPTEQPLTSA